MTSVTIYGSDLYINSGDVFNKCPLLKCLYMDYNYYYNYRYMSVVSSCCAPGTIIEDGKCGRTCKAPSEYYRAGYNICAPCQYLTGSTDSNDLYYKSKTQSGSRSGYNIYSCSYTYVGLSQGGIAAVLLVLILVYTSCMIFIRDENNKLDFKAIAGISFMPLLKYNLNYTIRFFYLLLVTIFEYTDKLGLHIISFLS